MSDETIRTICWAFVFMAGIQGTTTYLLVRFLMTGRAVFERRAEHDQGRIVRMDR